MLPCLVSRSETELEMFSGIVLLLVGPFVLGLGFMGGFDPSQFSPAVLVGWLANPPLFVAGLILARGRARSLPLVLASVALAIALSSLSLEGDSYTSSAAGDRATIVDLRIGLYVWLASFAVMFVGALAGATRQSSHTDPASGRRRGLEA